MAQVLGLPGRYVADQALERRLRALIIGIVSIAIMAVSAGFLFGRALPDSKISPVIGISIASSLLLGVIILSKWCVQRMDALEMERLHMQRGADGESCVARVLARFPNDFHVVHDISTPFGNIDHVVVGPTGVFVIDAKNWRGVITADGKGELLNNGRRTQKPVIRRFVARMMSIRDKVKALAPAADPFYHALFVFTAAHVEAKWGTTGNVHCLTDDQLYDYIVEKNFGRRLASSKVEQLAQAFLALARMDADFSKPASVPHPTAVERPRPAPA